MKESALLADENIAAQLVRVLRENGVDVTYVAEFGRGITDDEVLEIARQEGRLLLTEDKDFGELIFRMKRDIPGVVMLRLPAAQWSEQWKRMRTVMERYADKLDGCYTVVEKDKIRFRPLPDGGNGEL